MSQLPFWLSKAPSSFRDKVSISNCTLSLSFPVAEARGNPASSPSQAEPGPPASSPGGRSVGDQASPRPTCASGWLLGGHWRGHGGLVPGGGALPGTPGEDTVTGLPGLGPALGGLGKTGLGAP